MMLGLLTLSMAGMLILAPVIAELLSGVCAIALACVLIKKVEKI